MTLGTSIPYHLDQKAAYLVLTCVVTLGLTMLISIWHGDFSGIVAILGLVAVQIGSQDLMVLFGSLAPASMIVDIFWLVERNKTHNGHGWLIFFTVLDMVSKCAGAMMAWSLYTSTSGDVQYSLAPNTSALNNNPPGTGFGSSGAPPYQGHSSHPQGDPFASYAPPRPEQALQSHDPTTATTTTTYQPFPTSQAPVQVL